jgi:excisionase family DNA binding protein
MLISNACEKAKTDPVMRARFVSVQAAADELGVSHRIIRRAIREGRLQAVRLGGLLRIERAALERFLAKSTVAY